MNNNCQSSDFDLLVKFVEDVKQDIRFKHGDIYEAVVAVCDSVIAYLGDIRRNSTTNPEGIEFDDSWRQRQRADKADSAVREWHKWIHSEIAKRSDNSEPQEVVNYNKHVVFGLKLSLAAMKDAVNQGVIAGCHHPGQIPEPHSANALRTTR